MRLLHASDIHAGIARYATPGRPHARLEDVSALFRRMRDVAHEKGARLVILSGDTFDTRNPSPRVQSAVAEGLSGLTERCEVVVLPGNHDGMWTIGDPTSHTLAWLERLRVPDVHVPLQPAVVGTREAVVVAFPYPHKRAYDTLHPDMEPLERQRMLTAHLELAIADLYTEAATAGLPVIFAGHLTAVGSRVGSERAMRLEDDLLVGTDVLDLFDYVALGHIHKQQPVGQKGWYPGSPLSIDWGEAGQKKEFLLVDVQRGHDPVVQHVPSGARPMWDVEFPGDDAPEPGDDCMLQEPLVRLSGRYDNRTAAAEARRLLVPRWYAAGAAHVSWNPEVPPEERVSSRALPSNTPPLEAVAAYFASRGKDPEAFMDAARAIMSA